MPRPFSNELSTSLVQAEFWQSIVQDSELHPEIRSNAVTVYYKASALIRDLNLGPNGLTGSTHYKYVPIRSLGRSDYVNHMMSEAGMQLSGECSPLPIGNGEPDVWAEYKRMIDAVSSTPESQIVDKVVSRNHGSIIDQESAFADAGEAEWDKIDLCFFEPENQCIAFAEVKGIHDSRLRPGRDGSIEVLDQLARYRSRIEQAPEAMIDEFASIVSIKRNLGLNEHVDAATDEGLGRMMRKVVLIIGGCSADQVRAILEPNSEWQGLLAGLKDVAAGLIVCGRDGCRLTLTPGRQSRVFDTAVHSVI
ncbi:MAG: hypothetical protein O3B13_11240 [Planctomycetota bacterium]|nr:hypothetical protein [Planctomycetota bacterium]